MASSPLLVRQCLELATAAAPRLIERAVDHAVTQMQDDELRSQSTAQRREIADAYRELLRLRAAWIERYPAVLAAALQASESEGPLPTAAAPVRASALTLVDDEAVLQAIEAARLTQLLAPALEQPLAELDALMSAALGLETVQPARNPLRPERFAQSLRDLMQPAADPAWPGLWSRAMAQVLVRELQALYAREVQFLKDAKLNAASYRVLPLAPGPRAAAVGSVAQAANSPMQPAPAGASGAAAAADGAAGPGTGPWPAVASSGGELAGSAWADLSHYELGDELFQDFLYARRPQSPQGLAPTYYAQVDQQLAALEADDVPIAAYDPQAAEAYREIAPVDRPHRAVGTSSALDENVWGRWSGARERSLLRTRLKKDAREVQQVMGLEVVRKLVDQVASDPRLLAPVREAIVALEPALLRLALVAPRFFSEEQHAGRRLVERVAERSFKYNDEFATDFHDFFDEIRSEFQKLNEATVQDDAPFAQRLQSLEARWTRQDEDEEGQREQAVRAVHFAEERQSEAGEIAWRLSQRSDLDGVPAVVQDFLFGPWALAMAHARLTDDKRQIDPGGLGGVVTDLLWSVKRDQILRQPARVIEIIPGMLEKLRSGLALLGQDPRETESFFQALENLHRPVLKLRAKLRRNMGVDSQPAELEMELAQLDPALLDTTRQQPPAPQGQPWMAAEELEAAGFRDTQPSEPAPLMAIPSEEMDPEQEPDASDAPALADTEVNAVLAGLRQGTWVDLYAHRAWRRASLSWVSSRATLFMFISGGRQPHSMTRRSLERLVRARLLRPVDGQGVVAHAIDRLSRRAVRPKAMAA